MSALEIANENSSLLSFLGASAPKTSPFTYALRKNAPKFSKQKKVAVSKTSASSYGTEARFSIPRYGVLERMELKSTVTVSVGAGTPGDFGMLGAFSKFELKARDKTIATLYPENIVDWIHKQSSEAQTVWTDSDHMDTADIAVSTKSKYIPLPFSYMHRLANGINTRFAEPLELVATLVSASTVWIDSTVTAPTLELQCFFDSPGAEELSSMKQTMIKAGRAGVPRLQWSVYKEAVYSVVDNATTSTIDMKCPYPSFMTLIFVKPHANAYDAITTGAAVTRVQLQASGSDIIDLATAELNSQMVTPPFARTVKAGVHVLNYNLMMDGLDQTGVMSFKNLANPQIVLTHADLGTAYKVEVLHYYYQIESTSPDDGQISVRALT